jgi:acyl carrier protein phosphodiesterase
MNFFGHAVIARRNEATRGAVRAEFVLGSMLPDFASMLRVRPPQTPESALADGIAFHHATDDAFHGSESFLEFSRRAFSDLSAGGLSRGGARAVAHVGVELLLDGALARESASNEAYLSALESALTDRVHSQIQWSNEDAADRFRHLCHTLARRGWMQSSVSAELIAERLRGILASRPRLALDDASLSVVRDWVTSTRPLIESRAPLLVREIEQRLDIATRLER